MKGLIIGASIDAILLVIVCSVLIFINTSQATGVAALSNLGLFAVCGISAIILILILIILIAMIIVKMNNNG